MNQNTQQNFRTAGWRWEHTYAEQLPAVFFSRTNPEPVKAPKPALLNVPLALELGLDPDYYMQPDGWAELVGNTMPAGAKPIAQAYAGHQFGHFTMLGDGRALVLGEHIAPDGQRWDIQFKGSGPTPYSRRGDGRAALGPMLREYVISEAMNALGIPTTRSLAVIRTGETVLRETPLPGAVLTRVAASHIRIGTFEFAARQSPPQVKVLADYTLGRHYPAIDPADPDRYQKLWSTLLDRQLQLVAHWWGVGFIHGVMNTDNVALSGETIDYGPCAFMDAYDPATVFSSIDHQGRYAYGNQPSIAVWNAARLAETLLPVWDAADRRALDEANEQLSQADKLFQKHWLKTVSHKLGITTPAESDTALITDLFSWLTHRRADFTNTFVHLTQQARHLTGKTDVPGIEAPWNDPNFAAWRNRWQKRIEEADSPWDQACTRMESHNPIVIPRNHEVEKALAAAVDQDDYGPINALNRVLAQPYAYDSPPPAQYQQPAPPSQRVYQTFCGT